MGTLPRYRRATAVVLALGVWAPAVSMVPAHGAPANGTPRRPHVRSATITVRGRGDATSDTLYTFDGTRVTRTDFARGALAQDGALAGTVRLANPTCAQNVTCSYLTYRWTKCFQIADGYSHAYECFHVYSASTRSKVVAYRVGWWTAPRTRTPAAT